MFDLILFSLTFPDHQVFAIIISYRLGGLFGIFGRYNDSRELGVCKVCKRHARRGGMKGTGEESLVGLLQKPYLFTR